MSDSNQKVSTDEQVKNEETQVVQATESAQVEQNTNAFATSMTQQPIVIEQKGGGNGLAIGALILSLLALGASGFLFVQGQNVLKTQSLQLEQQLDKAALGKSENAQLLQSALSKQNEFAEQLAKLTKWQDENSQRLESVNVAYGELLKGRTNWLVDEVEVTLNIASQQLLLSGNVPVAINMLESVEQRLNRFEQPELLPIKQAVSQDLADLKNRPYLNVAATTLRLDRLQSAVAVLPLAVDGILTAQNQPEPVAQSNGGFWQRTWDSTTNMLKGMVEVRRLDNGDPMLLAPEQIYFVRENIRLRLLDARLALLQHNSEVYQNDLNAVEASIKQYFDVQAPNTQEWLRELNELKSLEVRMISDETLKNSLLAVRTYQNNVAVSLPVVLLESASVPSASVVTDETENKDIVASSTNHAHQAASQTTETTEGK